MSDDHKECAATTKAELEEYIMNPCIAKNEAEWWASREIERLRAEIGQLRSAIKPFGDAHVILKTNDLRAAKAALEGK